MTSGSLIWSHANAYTFNHPPTGWECKTFKGETEAKKFAAKNEVQYLGAKELKALAANVDAAAAQGRLKRNKATLKRTKKQTSN